MWKIRLRMNPQAERWKSAKAFCVDDRFRNLILALFTMLAYLSLLIHQQVMVINDDLSQIDWLVYQLFD
jgi:hypothetical protein